MADRRSNIASQQRIPTWARGAMLALVLVILLAGVLAVPARTRAEAQAAPGEMLIFDWNKKVIQSMSGFAQCKPVSACTLPGGVPLPNGDWSAYKAGGTLYMRALVRSIPAQQPGMQLEICFWQTNPKYGEECTARHKVPGIRGTDVTWSQAFNTLWAPYPITWTMPRWKEGVVIRNAGGLPVSSKIVPIWGGENPKKWYPLDLRFTAVLVPAKADGTPGDPPNWTKYGWPTP